MTELAPATLEGWYALHQVFAFDWAALAATPAERLARASDAAALMARLAAPPEGGWSAAFHLVGSADLMLVHFRPSLDDAARAGRTLRQSSLGPLLRLEYDFISVTEAALYHATLEAARAGASDSAAFRAQLDELVAAEREAPRMHQRLYPQVPVDMRCVCFYPMSKRRTHPDNWYMLPLDERTRLMHDHGLTGRRYAGRIVQIITGATGFDEWEWGVTLFARDPLEFKRIVSVMRYDDASARYAEFGPFYTGVRIAPEVDAWGAVLGVAA